MMSIYPAMCRDGASWRHRAQLFVAVVVVFVAAELALLSVVSKQQNHITLAILL